MKIQQLLSLFKTKKTAKKSIRDGRSERYVSSKSTNKKVLSIYSQILENAYSDSDYWYLMGDGYLLDKLHDFDRLDLLELKNDLGNWAFNELEIFQYALENDYHACYDDLLPTRAYVRGCIMLLANQYINKEKYIVQGLVNLDDELLLGGYIKDKELLGEIKNVLDKVEDLFADTQTDDENGYFFINTRFVLIKKTIQELYDLAK